MLKKSSTLGVEPPFTILKSVSEKTENMFHAKGIIEDTNEVKLRYYEKAAQIGKKISHLF